MSNPNYNYLSDITRLEIINHTKCDNCHGAGRIKIATITETFECPVCHGLGMGGREVIFYDATKSVRAELQDHGQTLKLYIEKREA